MSLATLLTKISGDIGDSYLAIADKGGTVPQSGTSSNLADSISTVPAGGDNLYAEIELYSWGKELSPSMQENCEVTNFDESTFNSFTAQYPPMSMGGDDRYMFNYGENWQAGDGSYAWSYSWEQGELWIAPEDMASTTGITVTVTDPNMGYAMLEYMEQITVDTSAIAQTVRAQSQSEVSQMTAGGTGMSWKATVGGVTFPAQALASVVTGSEITSLPSYFVDNCENLQTLDISGSSLLTSTPRELAAYSTGLVDFQMGNNITTIGDGFLDGCSSFNRPLSLDNVTSIGKKFLYGCSSFNQPLSFDDVTSVGSSFMNRCSAFNQPISLPKVTRIEVSFLNECTSFNSTISIPNVTLIHFNFLYGCSAYNQPLPSTPKLTAIGGQFLSRCSSFNQPIPYDFTKVGGLTNSASDTVTPGSLPGILEQCTKFNQPLDLTGVTLILGNTLVGCAKFNSSINLSTVQEIRSGLRYMQSFNQPINAPELTKGATWSTEGILRDCQFFNQPFYAPKLTQPGENFLTGCVQFNSAITLGEVTSIGSNFLGSCAQFNQPLPFLSKITTLQAYFLSGCSSFNQDLDLSSVTSFYGSGPIMAAVNSMTKTIKLGKITSYGSITYPSFGAQTSSAPAYQNGITIEVPDSATQTSFRNKFPDRTSFPYRKLNVVVTA